MSSVGLPSVCSWDLWYLYVPDYYALSVEHKLMETSLHSRRTMKTIHTPDSDLPENQIKFITNPHSFLCTDLYPHFFLGEWLWPTFRRTSEQ